jgi:hypothetical protein
MKWTPISLILRSENYASYNLGNGFFILFHMWNKFYGNFRPCNIAITGSAVTLSRSGTVFLCVKFLSVSTLLWLHVFWDHILSRVWWFGCEWRLWMEVYCGTYNIISLRTTLTYRHHEGCRDQPNVLEATQVPAAVFHFLNIRDTNFK